jgi:GT2 family glycosyltransferase
MSNAPKVLAVCVNWNGAEVLPATLTALEETSYPNLEVVVVDNASEDGSLDIARSSGLRTVQNRENLGYGGAINRVVGEYLGISADPPTFFLILNNDVILEKESVDRLVETAQANGAGVYGPKILRARQPSTLEAAWGELTFTHVLCRFRGEGESEGRYPDGVRRVQLLLGSVLLIHRAVFQRVGVFDPRFFLYHEEVDYLYRSEKSGFPAFFCPSARAHHIGGHSTRGNPELKTYWIRKNTVLFMRKHRQGVLHWTTWATTLTASLAFNLVALKWRRVRAIYLGARDGFREAIQDPVG